MEKATNSLRKRLHGLYYGNSRTAQFWRYGLLIFDIATIVYFIISSLLEPDAHNHTIDLVVAGLLSLDYVARIFAAARPLKEVLTFSSLMDVVVIASLIATILAENLGFLRVVRMLRLLRSYHLLRELRNASKWFRTNEEIIQSAINLVVFIFVVTALVFVVEDDQNPDINSYLDALYFTVATLTTTGFGDITMTDTVGRLMTVVIMIFGVALFLRLVQTIFRPTKVILPCPDCGLNRHDPDAVHCKHCGLLLNIPTEGEWS
ncbi:potassium channel family protein [Roseibium sp. CAU 1637]|uniref:Potassium channel family protein n=2 Tax=Stappiaceae TaxID=2821832 RepID=A0A939EQK9_9HYPH|nr:ion transporter [Roseibium limicola]MBO0346530.1 potassium channel family protein [Roseibium limicola]